MCTGQGAGVAPLKASVAELNAKIIAATDDEARVALVTERDTKQAKLYAAMAVKSTHSSDAGA